MSGSTNLAVDVPTMPAAVRRTASRRASRLFGSRKYRSDHRVVASETLWPQGAGVDDHRLEGEHVSVPACDLDHNVT
jgi:hypothetical protein